MALKQMQQPSLDTVIEIDPSTRTRLLGPGLKEPDFTHLYVSSCISIVFVCLATFWLWEHGFVASPTSHILVGITVFLLGFNALLGYRAKIKMKNFKAAEYTDYVNRLSQVTTHEKLSRPVWVERNSHVI